MLNIYLQSACNIIFKRYDTKAPNVYIFLIIKINTPYLTIHKASIATILDLFQIVNLRTLLY